MTRKQRSIEDEVGDILGTAMSEARGVLRNPGETLVIIVSSPSFLTSSDEINLVVDDNGNIVDAVIAPKDEVTQVMIERGYDDLPAIQLDVTGSQYRTLKKFAKTLAKTEKLRPKKRRRKSSAPEPKPRFAPRASEAERATNPQQAAAAKRRCMRG
jgi:hypothetical protein